MDGYAVRDATTAPDQTLRVAGESRAGLGFGGFVGAGEAVRIFTGAPMPPGTDRCIVQEHAIREGGAVRFRRATARGGMFAPSPATLPPARCCSIAVPVSRLRP